MTELAVLTAAEADYLVECEERISAGLQTFVEVGTALGMIRDNKLYRASHGTFEAYCVERWGFTDGRARQLIIASRTATNVTVAGLPAPANEGQARELARVPEADRADVWRAANDATDGKPTAAAIRAAANPDSLSGPTAPSVSATDQDRTGLVPPGATGEAHVGLDVNGAGTPLTSEVPSSVLDVALDGAGESPVVSVGEAGTTGDPRKPNRRPITDSFRDAAWDLWRITERLDRLAADDRFPRNAEQVARMSRGDLLRAVDLLATVVDRIPNPMKESTE